MVNLQFYIMPFGLGFYGFNFQYLLCMMKGTEESHAEFSVGFMDSSKLETLK